MLFLFIAYFKVFLLMIFADRDAVISRAMTSCAPSRIRMCGLGGNYVEMLGRTE